MFVVSVMVFLPAVVVMMPGTVRVVVPILIVSREDAFRDHGVARMVHFSLSVVTMALLVFSRTLALKVLPPGGLLEAVATVTSEVSYGMAYAFAVCELPVVVTLPLVGDGYGSKYRGEKCRSDTHVERKKRELL
jgi:formate-dependent nitrite reductase membrane component NrfD